MSGWSSLSSGDSSGSSLNFGDFVNMLYDFLTSDSEVPEEVAELETGCNELTLEAIEEQHEDMIIFKNAVKGIMALGNGREEEAADLVNRLIQYAASM